MDCFDNSAAIILHKNVSRMLNTDAMFLELFRRHNNVNIFVNIFLFTNVIRADSTNLNNIKLFLKDNYPCDLHHSQINTAKIWSVPLTVSISLLPFLTSPLLFLTPSLFLKCICKHTYTPAYTIMAI